MKQEIIENREFSEVYAIGDIHGVPHRLKSNLRIMEDALLIQLGDFGMGFYKKVGELTDTKEYKNLKLLNDLLADNNNYLIVVRGNHDDPSYWTDDHIYNESFSNIYYIPDYTHLTIKNKKFLFVGGAISVDRNSPHRKEGVTYWYDEVLNKPPEDLEECDILVTHTCPSYHNKPTKAGDEFLDEFLKDDDSLLEDLQEERSIMDDIVEMVKPNINIHGHFHNRDKSTKSFEWGECNFRTFDIDECDIVGV